MCVTSLLGGLWADLWPFYGFFFTLTPKKENNRSKRLSPTPSVTNLSLRRGRYVSSIMRSSNQGSVDGFRRERLQRLMTFDSLSMKRHLEARSRIESRTIACYKIGIWRRLKLLERIYGRFPSVDSSGRFTEVPNPGKPLYREETIYSTTQRRDVTHILC